MKYNQYVQLLHEIGFRELGYFNGLRTFLSSDTLITVEEHSGGFQLTIDSVAKNIGEVYYCYSDKMVCQILEEYLDEN